MHSTRGQASVELVALLPFLALAVAALAQAAALAHASWAASQAAGAAARAQAVGADPGAAARRSLPPHLERGLRVVARGGGEVEVRLRAPVLLPAVDLGTVAARGRFEAQS
jgi:hypothetical protein